jgi:hypothetical protein
MNGAWLRAGVVVALAGCSTITFSSERLENLQKELDRRYGLWRDEGIQDYSYHFERECACDSALTRPATVTVAGDSLVTSVIYADDSTAAPDSTFPSYFSVYGLFVQVQVAINLQVDSLAVEYDPALNYPKRIVIDQNRFQIQDELILRASEVTAKP